MHIDEKLVNIIGSAELEKELQMDQEVVIVVKGSVVSTRDNSKQDGTVKRKYSVKIAEAYLK